MSDPLDRMFNRLTDKIADGAVQAVITLLAMLGRPVATLTEIVFRKDMGERYYTLWNFMAGYLVLTVAAVPIGLAHTQVAYIDEFGRLHVAQTHDSVTSMYLIVAGWTFCLCVLTALQWTSVKNRYKKGGRWHSKSIGIPRFAFLPMWAEKAIPIVAGLILILCDIPLPGLLMIMSSVTSILLRWNEARAFKNRVLDMIDGQIEQEYLGKAVMERSKPQDVDGLRAPLPAYVSQSFREKVVQALADKPVPVVQAKAA